jgi:hypothetical protein
MTYPTFAVGEILTAADMNKVGMWLIKTVTIGTGVSTVPVTSCFSSDYDNYKVVVSGTNTAASATLTLTLGAGTGAAYYGSLYADAYTGASTGTNRFNNATSLGIGFAEAFLREQFVTMEIGSPNLARSTSLTGNYYGGTYSGWFAGTRADTTQYTGFNINATSNMDGGIIRVYGYRN